MLNLECTWIGWQRKRPWESRNATHFWLLFCMSIWGHACICSLLIAFVWSHEDQFQRLSLKARDAVISNDLGLKTFHHFIDRLPWLRPLGCHISVRSFFLRHLSLLLRSVYYLPVVGEQRISFCSFIPSLKFSFPSLLSSPLQCLSSFPYLCQLFPL